MLFVYIIKLTVNLIFKAVGKVSINMKLLFLALLVLEVYGKFLFSVKKFVFIFIKNAFLFKTQQLTAHLEMTPKSVSFLLLCLSLKKTNKLFYSSNVNTDF